MISNFSKQMITFKVMNIYNTGELTLKNTTLCAIKDRKVNLCNSNPT